MIINIKIVFDLDGVLRDLYSYIHNKYGIPYFKDWDWTYKGKDIFAWIKEDRYNALVYAPTTEYFLSIYKWLNGNTIEIWTHQPEEWKPFTRLWIRGHFGENYNIHYLTTEEKREKLDKHPDVWLVEDSPKFSHFDRIILIDRPDNQNIEVEHRIKSPEELKGWLK